MMFLGCTWKFESRYFTNDIDDISFVGTSPIQEAHKNYFFSTFFAKKYGPLHLKGR